MSTLTGQQIDASYQGILKTLDNAGLDGTNRVISDGVGTALPLEASTTTIKFTGNADFTTATVTGDNNTTYTVGSVQDGANADIKLTDQLGNDSKVTLVAGSNITLTNLGNDLTIAATGGATPGLIAGTGTDSIISDLTTNSAQASQTGGLAIGSGANAYGGNSNSIGFFAESASFANAFGTYTGANGSYSTAFGSGCSANGDFALSVGKQAVANSPSSISMGEEATVNNGSTSTNGVAIGRFAESTALGAVALGAGITAATDNTVTVNLLQIAGYANMNFADDAAAATGGIPLGGVYHTTGALKIRIV